MTLLQAEAISTRCLLFDPPLSDSELEKLCQVNDFMQFERTREGTILMHSPSGGFTSHGNAEIIAQLHGWWKTHRRGLTFDSNGGFFLPDGSMLSPDAAYVVPVKLRGLEKDALTGFPYICPDFVVELLSKFDSLRNAQEKMQRWIENGAALGWLIDPYQKHVHVYQQGLDVTVKSGTTIQGLGPVDGFVLNMDELWRCYEL